MIRVRYAPRSPPRRSDGCGRSPVDSRSMIPHSRRASRPLASAWLARPIAFWLPDLSEPSRVRPRPPRNPDIEAVQHADNKIKQQAIDRTAPTGTHQADTGPPTHYWPSSRRCDYPKHNAPPTSAEPRKQPSAEDLLQITSDWR